MSGAITPWSIESAHSGTLLRLRKLLVPASGFRLIILEFNDLPYRDHLLEHINQWPLKIAQLVVDERLQDFGQLETRLAECCRGQDVVHLLNLENWSAGEHRFKGFNYHREAIAEQCPVTLLFWMVRVDIKEFALQAPDMWAWRTAVLDFSIENLASISLLERSINLAAAPSAERLKRIEEIEQYLKQADARDQRHAMLFGELGDIYKSVGNWSEALRNFEAARQIYDEFDDRRDAAFMRVRIADVKFAQGEGDEALRRYGEVLTLFEKLDDVRERAVTQGRIADVLQARGQLDEALRIYREEVLPAFERLGDVRERAVTQGRIADVLQARGQLDEALRIYREEILPVYERLGAVRDALVCRANIGLTYLARGSAADRQPALEYLHRALADAQRLRIPETSQIEAIIRQVSDSPQSVEQDG